MHSSFFTRNWRRWGERRLCSTISKLCHLRISIFSFHIKQHLCRALCFAGPATATICTGVCCLCWSDRLHAILQCRCRIHTTIFFLRWNAVSQLHERCCHCVATADTPAFYQDPKCRRGWDHIFSAGDNHNAGLWGSCPIWIISKSQKYFLSLALIES